GKKKERERMSVPSLPMRPHVRRAGLFPLVLMKNVRGHDRFFRLRSIQRQPGLEMAQVKPQANRTPRFPNLLEEVGIPHALEDERRVFCRHGGSDRIGQSHYRLLCASASN